LFNGTVDTRLSRCAYRLTFISIRLCVCSCHIKDAIKAVQPPPPSPTPFYFPLWVRSARRIQLCFFPNLIASLRFLGDSGRDRDQDSQSLHLRPPPLSNLSPEFSISIPPFPFSGLRSPVYSLRACRFSLFLIGYMTRQLL